MESSNLESLTQSSNVAFLCYLSAAEIGFIHEPHLEEFRQRYQQMFVKQHLPLELNPCGALSNRNTFARVLVKQRVLLEFLKQEFVKEAQIISLGAGLDSFPFQIMVEADSHPPLRYVELDLSDVVRDKTFMAQDVLCAGTLFDQSDTTEDNVCASLRVPNRDAASSYVLSTCDLRKIDELESALRAANVDPWKPTLVLAEVVMVYMPPERSDALIKFFAEWLQGPHCFANIEHIISEETFASDMSSLFSNLDMPLLGLEKYHSLQLQQRRFQDLGWSHVSAYTLLDSFLQILGPTKYDQLDQIELLEDPLLSEKILSHYAVVVAAVDFPNPEAFLASAGGNNRSDNADDGVVKRSTQRSPN